MFIFGLVVVGICIGYPTLGLKMPNRDNPCTYRKKYGTTTAIQQMQNLAIFEYGGAVPKHPDANVLFTHKGFEQVGTGVRFDLPSNNELIC